MHPEVYPVTTSLEYDKETAFKCHYNNVLTLPYIYFNVYVPQLFHISFFKFIFEILQVQHFSFLFSALFVFAIIRVLFRMKSETKTIWKL